MFKNYLLPLLVLTVLFSTPGAWANPTPKAACTKAARNAGAAAVRASDYFKQAPAVVQSIEVKKSSKKNHYTVTVDFEFQNDENTDADLQEEVADVEVRVEGKKCIAVAAKIEN